MLVQTRRATTWVLLLGMLATFFGGTPVLPSVAVAAPTGSASPAMHCETTPKREASAKCCCCAAPSHSETTATLTVTTETKSCGCTIQPGQPFPAETAPSLIVRVADYAI